MSQNSRQSGQAGAQDMALSHGLLNGTQLCSCLEGVGRAKPLSRSHVSSKAHVSPLSTVKIPSKGFVLLRRKGDMARWQRRSNDSPLSKISSTASKIGSEERSKGFSGLNKIAWEYYSSSYLHPSSSTVSAPSSSSPSSANIAQSTASSLHSMRNSTGSRVLTGRQEERGWILRDLSMTHLPKASDRVVSSAPFEHY